MKNTIIMELYSAEEVTPESARLQIHALSNFNEGIFRPEQCDTAEPLRERFDPSDISEPIRWLTQLGADFKFKRLKPRRIEGYISNRHFAQTWTKETKRGPWVHTVPKVPEPLFLTSWTIWFDWDYLRTVGSNTLQRFAVEMFLVSRSEYGFMTSESDHKSKNFLIRGLPSGATSSMFVGTNPQYGIPGLYWLNLYGPQYAAWLGPQIAAVPGAVKPIGNGSISIQFGDSPEGAETQDVLTREREAVTLLGWEKFFDVRQPERKPVSPFVYQ